MWTITPLKLGITTVWRGGFIMKQGPTASEQFEVPHVAFLLKNLKDGRYVLVDTGITGDLELSSQRHNPVRRDPDQYLIPALAKHGVKLEEIDKVILTHLHWDHAKGVLELPKTVPVYVQRTELMYAMDPCPPDAKHYETNVKDEIPYFLQYFHQLRLIDGEQTLEDGLWVTPLPGHSPGSQGVVVDTPQGTYVMTGDLINCMENWTERIPAGICHSLDDYYRSFAKLEKLEKQGAKILPGHDFVVFDLFPDKAVS